MRSLRIGVVTALSVAIALYAIVGYLLVPLGTLVHPDMRVTFLAHRLSIYTHVFGSAIALLVGPLQFIPAIRRRRAVHRALGRLYFAALILGGLSGLHLSFTASGGAAVQSGLFVLGVLWLFTGFRGLRSILTGRVADHRDWMIRNFALTFAAVTLRLQMVVPMLVLGIDFLDVYRWIAWTCWVPNLIIAELIIRRGRARRGSAPRVEQATPDRVGVGAPVESAG